MKARRSILVAAALGAVVVIAAIFARTARDDKGGKVKPRAQQGEHPAERAATTADETRPHVDIRTDPEARRRADAMRARIFAVRERAQRMRAAGAASVGNEAQQPLGQYVQATIKKRFLPMARACYEELITREPDAGGKIALHIVVVGDPSIGGVVDAVQLNSDSNIYDPETLTCIIESMMALSFDAPPEGHDKVEFDYPFEFSPDSPDAPSR